MAQFRYVARTDTGSAIKGMIEAGDRRSALRELDRSGLVPSTLESTHETGASREKKSSPRTPKPGQRAKQAQATEASDAARTSDRPGRRVRRIRRKDLTAFTREMSTLLEADIPILSAIQGLAEEETHDGLRELLGMLSEDLKHGKSFSDALAEHPRWFGSLYISMVRVGEEAGALDKVLLDLANMLEKDDEIRGEVLGAIAYPCFVLAMGIATTIILLAFVLPRIFEMLQGMLDVLPLPTRILLGFSTALHQHWVWFLLGAFAAGFGLRAYLRSETGGMAWDRAKLRMPVMGSVFRAAALGRFAGTLGTLTRSGVSLLPALHIVKNTVGNRWLAESIEKVTESTRGGESLAGPLKQLNVLPPTMVQMIAVGEQTGKLDTMLLRVAAIQERHLRETSRTLISLLAPGLILLVGGIVGFIVIALLLPIFKMSSALG